MATSRSPSIGRSRISTTTNTQAASTSRCSRRCATRCGGSASTPIAIYLTGHDIGGEAAWDMAQSHPDVWAGAMPFIPRLRRGAKVHRPHLGERPVRSALLRRGTTRRPDDVAELARFGTSTCGSADSTRRSPSTKAAGTSRSTTRFLDLFDWMSFKKRERPAAGVRLRHAAAVGQLLLVARSRRVSRTSS